MEDDNLPPLTDKEMIALEKRLAREEAKLREILTRKLEELEDGSQRATATPSGRIQHQLTRWVKRFEEE